MLANLVLKHRVEIHTSHLAGFENLQARERLADSIPLDLCAPTVRSILAGLGDCAVGSRQLTANGLGRRLRQAYRRLPAVSVDVGVAVAIALCVLVGVVLDAVSHALPQRQQEGLEAAAFSGVQPNPVESNVTAGVSAYKAGNHDGVIAFGGGSALDAGKLIAFMKDQRRPVWEADEATGARAAPP